jgi:hypothetical protein
MLALESDPDMIGRAVMDALEMFRADVPFPDDYEKAANEVLKDTGFKTWRSFSKDAQRVDVRSVGAEVVVTPTVADTRGGYADLAEKSVKVRVDATMIGRAVIDSLQLCERKTRLG